MLQPKRTKYRKMMKGRNRGLAFKGSTIAFGSFALKTTENAFITNRQIEAARIAMTRHMQRQGKVWIRIFPDKPITSKPLEVRMGKGKGNLDHYVASIKAGRIMFEIDGIPEKLAYEALRLAAQKLPVATRTITRPDYSE